MKGEKIKISEKTCSLRDVLDIIGGKWSMPIIYILSKGKMRFKELERSVEGINTSIDAINNSTKKINKVLSFLQTLIKTNTFFKLVFNI